MVRRVSLLLYRAVLGLTTALSLTLLGCGGGSDATAPDPDPGHHVPDPGPDPQPQPQPQPDPDVGLAGTYGLVIINNGSKPGQMVLLSNPDGVAIGLYRFDAATSLTLTADGTYTLTMRLADDKNTYILHDDGQFESTPDGEQQSLTFESATEAGIYPGAANTEGLVIKYDIDGDGNPDTILGFARIG
jgi:hypothetical protein